MENVVCLTQELSLSQSQIEEARRETEEALRKTEEARRETEAALKLKDDVLSKVELIEKNIEEAKVLFAQRCRETSERTKKVCFKNFVDGMCHECAMVNLREPQFESIVVPLNHNQWKRWLENGIPSKHPFWHEDAEDLNDDS